MNALNQNWITEGLLDSEYKQYLFLAWIQGVKKEFSNSRLYPALADLIAQHRTLHKLDTGRNDLQSLFRSPLERIDLQKMRMVYKQIEEHPDLENYLNEMIDFAVPHIENALKEGKDIYELVDEHLALEPVGLMPIYRNEGYLFLVNDSDGNVYLYRYLLSRLQHLNEFYQGLETEYIAARQRTLSDSLENIKQELIKTFKDLPNPATFVAHSAMHFPLVETILPVAKRRLIAELNSPSAA